MNFEGYLGLAVLITGLCYVLDKVTKAIHRPLPGTLGHINDYLRSLFLTLLLIFTLRSFLIEPFRIPSGSQKPNLLVGDFILVNKLAYGVRLPLLGTPIGSTYSPKRGDITVFRFPPKPSIYFVKRIVGLPGDSIQYLNEMLIINGQPVNQRFLNATSELDESTQQSQSVLLIEENLAGHKHHIYKRRPVSSSRQSPGEFIVVVPPGHYFALGDNRDNSLDSRHWGFIPEHYLIGQAQWIFLSWNSKAPWTAPLQWIRWHRIGHTIN